MKDYRSFNLVFQISSHLSQFRHFIVKSHTFHYQNSKVHLIVGGTKLRQKKLLETKLKRLIFWDQIEIDTIFEDQTNDSLIN